jgi:crotonobetainyl-CoA:carnitine CoA-transferase CaiB-like acyl-CoA transferase
MTDLPLAGVRVLDITVVWSGPSSTRYLAALGAEVIRVESIRFYPNMNRGQNPYPTKESLAGLAGLAAAYPDKDPGDEPYNTFGPFLLVSQGKRSTTMEMNTEEGREAFHKLVAQSDILVENNSRVLSSALGLEWDILQPINPRLILVKMTPLGLSGPYTNAIGFGAHFEALTGLAALRAHPDAPPDDGGSTFHMDDVAPHGVVFAVLSALMLRERTGRGQLIEFPQAEYLMQGLGDQFLAAAADDRVIAADGNRHPFAVQGVYPCAGVDQWIAVSVRDDAEWTGLRAALGDPEWAAGDQFATALDRRRNQDELDERIGTHTQELDKYEVFAALQAHGVPAGPILNEADAYADPHFAARGVFRSVTHPLAGTHQYPSFGAKWSGIDIAWGVPAPLVGQDNEYVYKELLGYSQEQYQHFLDENLAGTHYPRPQPPS